MLVFAFAGLDKVVHYHGFVNALNGYVILPFPMGSTPAPVVIAVELAVAVSSEALAAIGRIAGRGPDDVIDHCTRSEPVAGNIKYLRVLVYYQLCTGQHSLHPERYLARSLPERLVFREDNGCPEGHSRIVGSGRRHLIRDPAP